MFTMDQLMLHLLGDYVLQTDHMAIHKTKKTWVAFFHALVYSLPFVLVCDSFPALFIIFFTHGLIDRFRLARYVAMLKNMLGDPAHFRSYLTGTGFPEATPRWSSGWLLVIIDNIMHLVINGLAIYYL